MQKKKRNWLIGGILFFGVAAIVAGAVAGTQLSHHATQDASSSADVNTANASSSTTSGVTTNSATKNSATQTISNSSSTSTKDLLPVLLVNNNGNYSQLNNDQVSSQSNADYYLNPNMTTSTNQTITFTWYGNQSDYNYGGIEVGTSSSATNNGYFQLTPNILSQYSYYYFVAQITNNGTIIQSQVSNPLQITFSNPITMSNFAIQLNSSSISSMSSEYQLNSSDTFDLTATANITGNPTSTTYSWYASTESGSNLTQLEDANDITMLGSGTANTFNLNQNVIDAQFTNFFVKVTTVINGQTYSATQETTLTYNNSNAISSASVSLSSQTVYVGQQNNYATLTLNYTVATALEGQSYTVSFYGENPYVNGAAVTGNYLIVSQNGTTSSSSTTGSATLQLTMSSAFYTQYYAVITIGNYVYTTAVTTQTVKQAYTSSNNDTPSIVNNNSGSQSQGASQQSGGATVNNSNPNPTGGQQTQQTSGNQTQSGAAGTTPNQADGTQQTQGASQDNN